MGSWLFLITPGFISIGVARALSNMGAFSDIDLVLISITLTGLNLFVVYLATSAVLRLCNKPMPDVAVLTQRPGWLSVLFGFSVAMGLVIADGYENDLVASTGESVRSLFYDSTTPETTFHETLDSLLNKAYQPPFPDGRDKEYAPAYSAESEDKKYVRISLKTQLGTVVTGRAERWHRRGELRQIYLTPVCIADVEGTATYDRGLVGTWIPVSEIARIDFFDGEQLSCVHGLTP